MRKPLAIQKCYGRIDGRTDGPTRQGVESLVRDLQSNSNSEQNANIVVSSPKSLKFSDVDMWRSVFISQFAICQNTLMCTSITRFKHVP